jgi:hypothetical protein
MLKDIINEEVMDRIQKEVLELYKNDYQSLELKNIDALEYIRAYAYWYPDRFIKLLNVYHGSNFEFSFDQIISMRAYMRFPNFFQMASRRTGKSFTIIMCEIIKCIVYPNTWSTYTAMTKENSSQILQEKVTELKNLMPWLEDEIPKKNISSGQENTTIHFPNGSKLYNATPVSSKGLTNNSILVDEAFFVASDVMNDSLLPTLTPRKSLKTQTQDRFNIPSVAQFSSAGYASSSAHKRFTKAYSEMAKLGNGTFVMASDYKLPLLYKRGLNKKILENKKETMPSIFWQMNYETKCVGGSGNSVIPMAHLERARTLSAVELSKSESLGKNEQYFMSVDIARSSNADNDNTVCTVGRASLSNSGQTESLGIVNIIPIPNTDSTEKQVMKIKLIESLYEPQAVVVDAHVLGKPFLDELNKSHTDKHGNEYLPWFSMNDDDVEIPNDLVNYKQNIFSIRGSSEQQTDIAKSVIDMFAKNKIRLLIKPQMDYENLSKSDFLSKKMGFYMTEQLINETLNVELKIIGASKQHLTFKRKNGNIKKDIFITVAYMAYYLECILAEESNRNKQVDTSKYLSMFN